jgi:hypothetical protein
LAQLTEGGPQATAILVERTQGFRSLHFFRDEQVARLPSRSKRYDAGDEVPATAMIKSDGEGAMGEVRSKGIVFLEACDGTRRSFALFSKRAFRADSCHEGVIPLTDQVRELDRRAASFDCRQDKQCLGYSRFTA